ncbi:alpha/beta hydrolase [uncultured Thermanaerothrix sp.]|uniref:alpha/beta fold hydrolase n=1 Tax=uncultured Thermanaerothrix sp. TaxID=1195149 RepID=UPI002612FD97|nr:alpha/beta hydrolase [uncultured Thermanaerothrix sp.]
MSPQPVLLAYEIHGEGLPVIFLHGFPFNRHLWDALIPHVAPYARMVLPDLRGFGESPTSADVLAMSLLADDVCYLMDHLNLPQAALVGHSMGGYVALAFAHQYPERLAGLALVASHADPDSSTRRESRYHTVAQIRNRGILPLLEDMPQRLTSSPAVQEKVRLFIQSCSPQTAIQALLGMAEREDANPWLRALHVPFLVVTGSADSLIDPTRIRTMLEPLSTATWVELPGVGHLPMLEAPVELAKALLDWIHQIHG